MSNNLKKKKDAQASSKIWMDIVVLDEKLFMQPNRVHVTLMKMRNPNLLQYSMRAERQCSRGNFICQNIYDRGMIT